MVCVGHAAHLMKSPDSRNSGQSSFRRYRRLLPFVKPARWHFIGGLVAGLIYAVSTGAGLPVLIRTILPGIFNQESEPKEVSPKVLAIA